MSMIVKLGKKAKRVVKKVIAPAEKHYVGYTRRIERIETKRRICAMTFDDGPMDLPASPDRFEGRSLTDVLLDTLWHRQPRLNWTRPAPPGAASATTTIRIYTGMTRAARYITRG